MQGVAGQHIAVSSNNYPSTVGSSIERERDHKGFIWVTTMGLRTTCFPSSQESDPYTAPESSSTRFLLSTVTVTAYISCLTFSENTSFGGFTVTVTPLGDSTRAVYTEFNGPTFVAVRINVLLLGLPALTGTKFNLRTVEINQHL